MYCPRCGQERTSNVTSYCSRCGILLDYIAEVTLNEGVSPYYEEDAGERRFFTRRNGLIFALFWFIFIVLIITPLLAIFDAHEDMLSVAGFLGSVGALVLAITALFLPGKKKARPGAKGAEFHRKAMEGRVPRNALPEDRTEFADDYVSPPDPRRQEYDTGPVSRPPSVIEGTTRLLKKEENE